jgi:hypothetical protein
MFFCFITHSLLMLRLPRILATRRGASSMIFLLLYKHIRWSSMLSVYVLLVFDVLIFGVPWFIFNGCVVRVYFFHMLALCWYFANSLLDVFVIVKLLPLLFDMEFTMQHCFLFPVYILNFLNCWCLS